MAVKYSAEQRVADALKELELSANLLSAYSGVGRDIISRCLQGTRQFTNEEAQVLQSTLKLLAELQSSFPIRLDWSDVRGINGMLVTRRQQEKERLEALPFSQRVQVG